jgi:hypothetical protein
LAYGAAAKVAPTMDMFDQPSPSTFILETFRPRKLRINDAELTTTPAFDAYWYFASARQNIFYERVTGRRIQTNYPEDDILRTYRFTNAYRASDRVSQYLIQHVLSDNHDWSPNDLFFRIMLFKIFNKIETWEALEEEFGIISYETFNFDKADRFLSDRQDQRERNYSAAYIMPSAGSVFGYQRKHSNHLALLKWMLEKDFARQLQNMSHMSEAFDLIVSAPSFGPFLAYQFVTDLNYSQLTDFSEMEFVVAGPGAHDGISKCFETTCGVTAEQIIAHMAARQTEYFEEFGHAFRDLWGRPLQLIDCQNLFCEISKYSRVAFPKIEGVSGRTRIKQSYRRSSRAMYAPTYPVKWGITVPSSCAAY